jgi:hypothetical protein
MECVEITKKGQRKFVYLFTVEVLMQTVTLLLRLIPQVVTCHISLSIKEKDIYIAVKNT